MENERQSKRKRLGEGHRAILMVATTFVFLGFNHVMMSSSHQNVSQVQEVKLYKPLLLSPRSKFHQKFVSQLENNWRETIGDGLALRSTDKLAEQLSLYFLPNDSSCAVVVLLLEGLSVYRDDGNKFAIGETGISSDGSFVMVYGYDPSKQRFDQLFRSRVVDFHGSVGPVHKKSSTSCPDLLITAKSSVNSLDQYLLKFDLEGLRYVKQDHESHVKVVKNIFW